MCMICRCRDRLPVFSTDDVNLEALLAEGRRLRVGCEKRYDQSGTAVDSMSAGSGCTVFRADAAGSAQRCFDCVRRTLCIWRRPRATPPADGLPLCLGTCAVSAKRT